MSDLRALDVDQSSLCNCVVNFLLQENYILTAFELFHELIEDGRNDQAIRLREYFADPSLFPPDQIARFNSLRVADPQTLLEEKSIMEEKLAISEYELRLAKEDIAKLKAELEKQAENFSVIKANGPNMDTLPCSNKERSFVDLGPLKDAERKDINCAVKEYLVFAGYRLTAMTFFEEVTDQNLDVWPNSPACLTDALRRYYYQFLSSAPEAAEEKIAILRDNESLIKETQKLNDERNSLLKNKEVAEGQILLLTKTLEAVKKEMKDKEILVHDVRQSLELQRKELNDCRAEITSLKMHIEGSRARRGWTVGENAHPQPSTNDKEEMGSSYAGSDNLEEIECNSRRSYVVPSMNKDSVSEALEMHVVPSINKDSVSEEFGIYEDRGIECLGQKSGSSSTNPSSLPLPTDCNGDAIDKCRNGINVSNSESHLNEYRSIRILDSPKRETSDKLALETIQILSDALPKIVPYVLINHREELLPLMMCSIERHPESSTRDSLTHTLFNLIKRPDEQQRRVIMDACVTLAKNVGEMRTETELLPQCWEQINHAYEERRLLVAQSCGELAEFVRPEIRDSLILSIVQQLIEDPAAVVREAAAHNLALLLHLFPNTDKYFKVEEMMFQLACDPSGVVVDTTLGELVPALISWGRKLDHILQVLLSHILGAAQRCTPLSGVEGSVDSQLRVLGETERWNIDVLLRMLVELVPFIHQKAVESCPFTSDTRSFTNSESENTFFSHSLLKLYAEGNVNWPAFEWLHIYCFHDLIQLACLLPSKEDNLRKLMAKFMLEVGHLFGVHYVTHIMLPIFLVAVGDTADLTLFPLSLQFQMKGLRPKTDVEERLSIICVLPLLFSGVLGSPLRQEQLSKYLRKLLVQNTDIQGPWSRHQPSDLVHAVRFLCTFDEHHGVIFTILWEMVVSSNISLKINAACLLKALVPYTDVKGASTHVLPALVTLGSDQNLNVKCASIDAFGAVAQHFKNDMIVDKIMIQTDAFLEDGSHEAIISVIHALVVAVPHATNTLREYLLSKIFHLSATPILGNDVIRRRERANALCEAIRALDATDLPANSTRDLLIPAIQNLLKDPDSLDPAHKEALEIIMKERSGGTLETISKVMGAHLGIASSVSSFFGDSGLLGKKETGADFIEPSVASPRLSPQSQLDDTRFKRIMRGNFGDMLRGRAKGQEDPPR